MRNKCSFELSSIFHIKQYMFLIAMSFFIDNSLSNTIENRRHSWYGGASDMIDYRIYSNQEAKKPRKLSTKNAIEVSVKDFFDLLNDKEKAKDVYLRLPLDLQDSCGEVAKEFSSLFTIEQFRCISEVSQEICNALKMDFHEEEDLFYFYQLYGYYDIPVDDLISKQTGKVVETILSDESYLESSKNNGFYVFFYLLRYTFPPELFLKENIIWVNFQSFTNESQTEAKIRITTQFDNHIEYIIDVVKINEEIWVPKIIITDWYRILNMVKGNISLVKEEEIDFLVSDFLHDLNILNEIKRNKKSKLNLVDKRYWQKKSYVISEYYFALHIVYKNNHLMRLLKMDNLYPFVIFPYFTVKHYYDAFGLEYPSVEYFNGRCSWCNRYHVYNQICCSQKEKYNLFQELRENKYKPSFWQSFWQRFK